MEVVIALVIFIAGLIVGMIKGYQNGYIDGVEASAKNISGFVYGKTKGQ